MTQRLPGNSGGSWSRRRLGDGDVEDGDVEDGDVIASSAVVASSLDDVS